MAILNNWSIDIDIDQVLQSQGADPSVIRARRPKLVDAAIWAIQQGNPLLKPIVLIEEYQVVSFAHQKIYLNRYEEDQASLIPQRTTPSEHASLSGALVSQHIAPASTVYAILVTVGQDLDTVTDELMTTDPVLGWAMDGFGSAAVEALASQVCVHIEQSSARKGWQTTIPLSPGLIGWPIEHGQPEVFRLVNANEIGITLHSNFMMTPRKSLSMVLGAGEHIHNQGTPCDYCSLDQICKYKNHPVSI